jgi:hypothetical protein
MSLFSWLRRQTSHRSPRRDQLQIRPAAPRFRPRLEALEDRALPSTYYAATASQLIADISAANKAGGANTIVLTAPTTSPYVLTAVDNSTDGPTGLPVISKKDSLTIVGNGDTIERSTASGTPAFRLLDVAGGGSLTLENLTLQNGQAQAARATGYSADGGAIYNQGTLVLSGVTVQLNTASGSYGGNAAGGGIWSNGSLTLENSCLVQDNSAVAGFGGASNAYGGGICVAAGTANITGTQFGGQYPNKAEGGSGYNHLAGSAYGGAVCVLAGTATLSGDSLGGPLGPASSVNQNTAVAGIASDVGHGYGYGGGLCVLGGTVTLTSDVVENNSAGYFNDWGNVWEYGYGGGIYVAAGATVSIDSFTYSYAQYSNNPYPGVY